jgi:hypothetical protein
MVNVLSTALSLEPGKDFRLALNNIFFTVDNGGSLDMLTIEHEHIVLLIMLTMINFNCIALNSFLSKKFNILQTLFLCIHCQAENLSNLQQ